MDNLRCEPCNEHFSPLEINHYDDHLKSDDHFSKARNIGIYFCGLCRSGATSEGNFKDHIRGKQHEKTKTRLLQVACRQNTERNTDALPQTFSTPEDINHIVDDLRCELCNENFSPWEIELYDEHLRNEGHLTNARNSRRYFCGLCRSPASSDCSFIHHIDGKQHEKTKTKLLLLVKTQYSYLNNNSQDTKLRHRVVTKDGPYILCEFCGASCNTLLELEKHKHGQRCRKQLQQLSTLGQQMQFVGEADNSSDAVLSGEQNGIRRWIAMCDEASALPEPPNLTRRSSQDSNLSDAMSMMSYFTAKSEISAIVPPAENLKSTSQTITELSPYEPRLNRENVDMKLPSYQKGRGYCLIINQAIFPKYPKDQGGLRNGTNIDAGLLLETFTNLNFEVKVETDLIKDDMQLRLEEIAYFLNQNPKKYALMCICLLSHGNEDFIQGVDGEGMHIRDIVDIFNSKNCPGMKRKPKLFLTNACRGLHELSGVKVR